LSEKSDTQPPVPVEIPLSEAASAHAPFLYFEEASAFGHMNGVVRVTLETTRLLNKGPGPVYIDRVAVAHLRMNFQAALSLKDAIEKVLLMVSPPPTEAKN
jgi:hypothetical protein